MKLIRGDGQARRYDPRSRAVRRKRKGPAPWEASTGPVRICWTDEDGTRHTELLPPMTLKEAREALEEGD